MSKRPGTPGRDPESRPGPGTAVREETDIHKERKAVQAAGSTCAKALGHRELSVKSKEWRAQILKYLLSTLRSLTFLLRAFSRKET